MELEHGIRRAAGALAYRLTRGPDDGPRFCGNALSSLGVLQEDLDRKAVVHRLTTPTRGGGVLVNVDTLLLVVLRQLPPVGQGAGVIGSDAVERLSVRSDKAQRAVIEDLYYHSALMHLPVMEAT